jgi:hypothetical protein
VFYKYCRFTKKMCKIFFALWKIEERKCRNKMQVRFEKREMLKANEQKFGSYKWLITECHYNHRINYLLKVEINFFVSLIVRPNSMKKDMHSLICQEFQTYFKSSLFWKKFRHFLRIHLSLLILLPRTFVVLHLIETRVVQLVATAI